MGEADEKKKFVKMLYSSNLTEQEIVQRMWETQLEVVDRLEANYDKALRSLEMQVMNKEEVKQVSSKLQLEREKLKNLDLKCHEIRGIKLSEKYD